MRHGTTTCYTNGKCRCDPCREAMKLYQRQRPKRERPKLGDLDWRWREIFEVIGYDALTTRAEREQHGA